MSGSLLSRVSPHPLSPEMTPLQSQVDASVGSFVHHATDWKSLAALTAAGGAYRLGKAGAFSVKSLEPLSIGLGLGAEVSAFELTHRGLQTNQSNLWRWSGSAGLRQGLLSSLVSFSTLKGFGKLTQGQNLIVQHLSQDAGMVTGHQLVHKAGIGPKPEGSLAEQFLHAEAMNWQLKAGTSLLQGFAPGLHALERGLDLSLSAPALSSLPEGLRILDFKNLPAFSLAVPLTGARTSGAIGPILLGHSVRKRKPVEWPETSDGVFAHGRSVRTALEKIQQNPKVAQKLFEEILNLNDELQPRQMHFLLSVFEAGIGTNLVSVRKVRDRLLQEKNLLVDLYTLTWKTEKALDPENAQAWREASEAGSRAVHSLFYPREMKADELKGAKRMLFAISKEMRRDLDPEAVKHLYEIFAAELSGGEYPRLRRLLAHHQDPAGFAEIKDRIVKVIEDWDFRRGSLPQDHWRTHLFTDLIHEIHHGKLSHAEARKRLKQLEKELLPGPESLPEEKSEPLKSSEPEPTLGVPKSPLPPKPTPVRLLDPLEEIENRSRFNPKWGEVLERVRALLKARPEDKDFHEAFYDLLDVAVLFQATPPQMRGLLDQLKESPSIQDLKEWTDRINVEHPSGILKSLNPPQPL